MDLPRLCLTVFFFFSCGLVAKQASAQEGEAPAASQDEEKPKPKKVKKKAKKKAYDYEKSKYKAFRVDPEPSSYKFGPDGKPVEPAKKKKIVNKKPVTPTATKDEIDGVAPLDDCGSDGSCREPVKS